MPQSLPIVDEALVRTLHGVACAAGNDEKHTALFNVAASRAESVEQFDAAMVKTFVDLARFSMYERNFRRASLLLEKAWGSMLETYPDNRLFHLEALWMLKECYVRLDMIPFAVDASNAALAIMQECVDRRDAYALNSSAHCPQKFCANVLDGLKRRKDAQYAILKRRAGTLDMMWSKLKSTIDPPCE
jgi:hypothetical protein